MRPKAAERPNCLKMEGFRTAFVFIFKHFEAGEGGGGLALRTLPQGDEAERSRNAKLFEIGGFAEGSSIHFQTFGGWGGGGEEALP